MGPTSWCSRLSVVLRPWVWTSHSLLEIKYSSSDTISLLLLCYKEYDFCLAQTLSLWLFPHVCSDGQAATLWIYLWRGKTLLAIEEKRPLAHYSGRNGVSPATTRVSVESGRSSGQPSEEMLCNSCQYLVCSLVKTLKQGASYTMPGSQQLLTSKSVLF